MTGLMLPPKPRLLIPAHLVDEMERVRRAAQPEPQGQSMTPDQLVDYVNDLETAVGDLAERLRAATLDLQRLALTRAWEMRPELFCARRKR